MIVCLCMRLFKYVVEIGGRYKEIMGDTYPYFLKFQFPHFTCNGQEMNYEADEHTSCIIAGSMERKIWWRSTLRIAVGINILVKRDNMRTGDARIMSQRWDRESHR